MAPERQAEPAAPRETDVTLAPGRANLLALAVFLVALVLFLGPFSLLWGSEALRTATMTALSLKVFFPVFIAGIVVHEGLHAMGWMLAARVPSREIKFGINWRGLYPYAHCRVPVDPFSYRFSGALPGVLLGFLPAMLGLVFGVGWLVFWGAIFVGAAGGDFIVLWLIRSVPPSARILDHPEKIGCKILHGAPTNETVSRKE